LAEIFCRKDLRKNNNSGRAIEALPFFLQGDDFVIIQ